MAYIPFNMGKLGWDIIVVIVCIYVLMHQYCFYNEMQISFCSNYSP